MLFSDFQKNLDKLPFDELQSRRKGQSVRSLAYFLGSNEVAIQKYKNNPDEPVKESHIRCVDFLLKMPKEQQIHILFQSVNNPILSVTESQRCKVKHYDALESRLLKLGMSKLGVYSLLGTRNSVVDNARKKGAMSKGLAAIVGLTSRFSNDELLELAVEYETSERKLPALKEKLMKKHSKSST
ncbi:hypothetical protein ACTN3U_003515 [Vibrio alginolyticus]